LSLACTSAEFQFKDASLVEMNERAAPLFRA
jgi:hypothetical protein